MRWIHVVGLLLFAPASAHADAITLGEVVEGLRDGEHADVFVAPAPQPGETRVVRRREVRRVLKEHGIPERDLHIPRAVRVERATRALFGEALEGDIGEAIQAVAGVCTVVSVRAPHSVTVGRGELELVAEPPAGNLRSGSRSVALTAYTGGAPVRFMATARFECPPPVMGAGDAVRIEVQVGAVRASAPGRTRQSGRVGDVIRVVNTATGARLMARVVDAERVEVVR